MNLYDDKEHVISSDEYSDDDDALMNDAVRSQDYNIGSSKYAHRNIQPKWRIDQKQNELSSLIRRNKISVIYKNKSIKWLNNKKQRERYKEHIYLIAKRFDIGQIIPGAASTLDKEELKNTNKNLRDPKTIQDIVTIEDDVTEFTNKSSNKRIIETKKVLQKVSTLKCNTEVITSQLENDSQISDKKNAIMKETKLDLMEKIKKNTEERTSKSLSFLMLNESNEIEIKPHEEKIRVESPQFYRNVNDMFSKFDKIATNHVDTISCSTLTATKEKIKCLSNEINTLNEILHTKEMEWNRLLHLKMVKEEIYSRLSQKLKLFQLKDHYIKKQGENSLLELKELENYLLDKQKLKFLESNQPSITIQKLIENRANMNAEDLEREKNNTSRLHSLLVSRNMLYGSDLSENTSAISNGKNTGMGITNNKSELHNNTDGRSLLSNKSRQGEFRDVKSLIPDFKQRNTELLPRVGKRIKSSELNPQQHNFSIPVFENTSSGPQCFAKDHPVEFYTLRNSVDVSITPIERIKKLSSSHGMDFVNAMNNHNIRLEEKYSKSQLKRDFDEICPKKMQYPLCQECNSKESRFVCAGCGNQWYCSKKCQISAWDKHSELCTD